MTLDSLGLAVDRFGKRLIPIEVPMAAFPMSEATK